MLTDDKVRSNKIGVGVSEPSGHANLESRLASFGRQAVVILWSSTSGTADWKPRGQSLTQTNRICISVPDWSSNRVPQLGLRPRLCTADVLSEI
jgi:hypothetical protein